MILLIAAGVIVVLLGVSAVIDWRTKRAGHSIRSSQEIGGDLRMLRRRAFRRQLPAKWGSMLPEDPDDAVRGRRYGDPPRR